MASYTSYPRQDLYETTLSSDVDASTLSIPVAVGPSFSMTTGGANSYYVVIDYDSSTKYELLEADGVSGSTIQVKTGGRGKPRYEGGGSTAQSHASGAKVLITHSWKNFSDIATAIGTKANSGANSDITSLSGLSTPLSVAQGGTGSGTSGGARTNLGAAASGANSDITSLSGLSTPLSVAQGGTGSNSLTSKSVLVGNGTSAPTGVAPGSASNVLASNGTDWTSTTMPAGAAHKLLDNINITDANNDNVARGALVIGNSTPKWSALTIGASGTVLKSNGTDPSWGLITPELILLADYTTNAAFAESRWAAMFNSNKNLLWRDQATATTVNYITKPTTDSMFLNITTARTGLAINVNIGCRVTDGSTEYLLAADDAGTTVKRYNSDGSNETSVTFSGTAPTNIARMGWDVANSYLWIMDAATKAGTTIRRYTFSGSTLTNINSNITLSAGAISTPGAAGSGNMLIGSTYMVLEDAGSISSPVFKRYNKSTGAGVDQWAPSMSGTIGYRGMVISSDNRLYIAQNLSATAAASQLRFLLYDLG